MASDGITLIGYRFSVYTRVAMLVLQEKRLDFCCSEVNPFEAKGADALQALNPFRRVPVLLHRGHRIYETAAITRYLDAAFPDPSLTPADPAAAAAMQQVIGIVDSYGYRALVRQVFANLIFRPLEGARSNPEEVEAGLRDSRAVLAALEAIARDGRVLDGEAMSLADFHLLPMIDYFRMTREGEALLRTRTALWTWWERMAARPSTIRTRPDLKSVPMAASP